MLKKIENFIRCYCCDYHCSLVLVYAFNITVIRCFVFVEINVHKHVCQVKKSTVVEFQKQTF